MQPGDASTNLNTLRDGTVKDREHHLSCFNIRIAHLPQVI